MSDALTDARRPPDECRCELCRTLLSLNRASGDILCERCRRVVEATGIRKKIADYLSCGGPSDSNIRCFVGMVETGEATLADFAAVRPGLESDVADYGREIGSWS